MTVNVEIILEVPDDFDEMQVCEDIESAIMYKTCFNVVNFENYKTVKENED